MIDGESIAAVGTRDEISVSPNTPTVDVQGATVLPGFINAHVHGAYDEERLEAWAHDGVTTVRDTGAWVQDDTGIPPPPRDGICPYACGTLSELFAFRDEASDNATYSRLVAAGPIISAPFAVRDGWYAVTSPDEAEPTINALLDEGADFVKVYIDEPTHGHVPTASTITAMVEAAHARQARVAAHILLSVHLEYALEAGVDDLAHMVYDVLPEELVAEAIDDNVYWEPTLELQNCTGNVRTAVDNLRAFSQAGGNVALGTDFSGYPNCDFDLGMPMTEIELMLQADMTPMQVIVAATKNAAHVCGLDDQIGTLEPGKAADVLVVEGNPLEDMTALADVRMVVHDGVVIRDEYSAAE